MKTYVCKRDGRCPLCNEDYANVMRLNAGDYARWLQRQQCALSGASTLPACRIEGGEAMKEGPHGRGCTCAPSQTREATLDDVLYMLGIKGREQERPPDPPDLAARIRAARAAEGPIPDPKAAVRLQSNGAPMPPDLGERIRAARAAGR